MNTKMRRNGLTANTRAVQKAARKGDLPQSMRKLLTQMREQSQLARLKVIQERPKVEFEIPQWVELPAPTKKHRNKTPITDEVANRILVAKRSGASDGMAAAYAGIHPKNQLSRWLNDDSGNEPFATFQRLYEEAKAFPKFFLLDAIMVNAYYEPELALKLLQRLEPEQFGEVILVKGQHTVGADETFTAILERAATCVAEIRNSAAKQIGAGRSESGVVIPHDPRGDRGGR